MQHFFRRFVWFVTRIKTVSLFVVLTMSMGMFDFAYGSNIRKPWLLFPVDVTKFERISSWFGARKMEGQRDFHGAVDLVAPAGTKVLAAREGIVVETGYGERSGWYIKLKHKGWHTIYCHLLDDPKRFGIQENMTIHAGQVIGQVGSSGRATGPHLHFAVVHPSGRVEDPLKHLFTPVETWRIIERAKTNKQRRINEKNDTAPSPNSSILKENDRKTGDMADHGEKKSTSKNMKVKSRAKKGGGKKS